MINVFQNNKNFEIPSIKFYNTYKEDIYANFMKSHENYNESYKDLHTNNYSNREKNSSIFGNFNFNTNRVKYNLDMTKIENTKKEQKEIIRNNNQRNVNVFTNDDLNINLCGKNNRLKTDSVNFSFNNIDNINLKNMIKQENYGDKKEEKSNNLIQQSNFCEAINLNKSNILNQDQNLTYVEKNKTSLKNKSDDIENYDNKIDNPRDLSKKSYEANKVEKTIRENLVESKICEPFEKIDNLIKNDDLKNKIYKKSNINSLINNFYGENHKIYRNGFNFHNNKFNHTDYGFNRSNLKNENFIEEPNITNEISDVKSIDKLKNFVDNDNLTDSYSNCFIIFQKNLQNKTTFSKINLKLISNA